jgi:hypothetical protein
MPMRQRELRMGNCRWCHGCLTNVMTWPSMFNKSRVLKLIVI